MDFKNKWFHIIKKTLTWIARRLLDCGSIWMLHDCAQGMTQATDEQYFVSVDAFERLIKKTFRWQYFSESERTKKQQL